MMIRSTALQCRIINKQLAITFLSLKHNGVVRDSSTSSGSCTCSLQAWRSRIMKILHREMLILARALVLRKQSGQIYQVDVICVPGVCRERLWRMIRSIARWTSSRKGVSRDQILTTQYYSLATLEYINIANATSVRNQRHGFRQKHAQMSRCSRWLRTSQHLRCC